MLPLQGWDRRIGFEVRKGESPDTLLTRRAKALDSEAYGTRTETRERGKLLGMSSIHFRKTGKQLMGLVRKFQEVYVQLKEKEKPSAWGFHKKQSFYNQSHEQVCC